jgi:hypothetical protein
VPERTVRVAMIVATAIIRSLFMIDLTPEFK